MTQQEIQDLLENIKAIANQAATVSEAFLPPQALIPMVIGRAVLNLAPTLEQDVYNLIKGVAPTPEQDAATAEKLKVLGSPDGL